VRVELVLPALTEARSPFLRPVKYSLFPPLGLATLAGYLRDDDNARLQDEHVEDLDLDRDVDLVGIEVYVTSARRAYAIADRYRARGTFVVLGGLHVSALPEEALRHADAIVLGPAEEAWPRLLADLRAGRPERVYRSRARTLTGLPSVRRDLVRRELYLVPNSIVVSRGCPHACAFCYKDGFFASRRPSRAACGASSSASRRWARRPCAPTASARTSAATTPPRSAGSTTTGPW
jgi:radical SAM superfamily enzyme YgiQ (UPF0313 family)